MEVWKDIEKYEGRYQISNYGKVKSSAHKRRHYLGGLTNWDERILKSFRNPDGYLLVKLYKNGDHKTIPVHRLVWDAFGNSLKNNLEIDHKDESKQNNHIDNLQLLTKRENVIKSIKLKGDTKYPTGVYKLKHSSRYYARIWFGNKVSYLGAFDTPKIAHQAYLQALENRI